MTLTSGTRLGPYEITAPIGAGGMGEVYKARDTRLDRTVAIKVLPDHLSQNAELRHRFEQEARAVSSLNHPHICTLHDVGQEGDIDFLVMEYLDGETLLDRLRKGPLSLAEALAYGVHIADALDKAHRQGVVHRDVKPGNIIITSSGSPKLLDFGLAKLQGGGAAVGDLSAVTEQKPLTEQGAILGTFQYMAPEQLEGKEADVRTDLFAFGALLYEMVTGKKAFEGKSQASLIGAIMGSHPPSISAVQSMSPPLVNLNHLVARCLAKEPDERWQTASDVMHELKWIADAGGHVTAGSPADGPTVPKRRARVMAIGGVMLGAVLASLVGWGLRAPTPPSSPVRFKIDLPAIELLVRTRPAVAVSPDGTKIAYAATSQLYLRPMGAVESTPIPGTEGATNPFFSPDSQSLGFWSAGHLKKVLLRGGAPVTICEAPNMFGASWGLDDTILYGHIGGVWQVAASGGTPKHLVVADASVEEWAAAPQSLPGGKAILFGFGTGNSKEAVETANIVVQSLETTGQRKILIEGAGVARYLPSGHLMYGQAANLLAMPFDAERLEATGGPVSISQNVDPFHFSSSSSGALVYAPDASAGASTLAWVDRQGHVTPLSADPAAYLTPRLSPEGDRVAVTIDSDVWVYYIEQGTRTRLTFDAKTNLDPVWSPDGSRIVFGSRKDAIDTDMYRMRADGSGEVEPLLVVPESSQDPHSVSPDGKLLAFYERMSPVHRDIWLLPLEGDPAPEPFVVTPFNERSPSFSPDNRFLAYVSDESGQDEVYVQGVSGPGGKVPVSTAGGREPVWSRDGKELFYWSENRLMAVDVETGSAFEAGAPQLLLEAPYIRQPNFGSGSQNYDVSPDGQRFLMVLPGESSMALHVVLNWFEELNRLVPIE